MLLSLLNSLWYKLVFTNIPKLPGRMSIAMKKLWKNIENLYIAWNKLFKITKHAVTITNM